MHESFQLCFIIMRINVVDIWAFQFFNAPFFSTVIHFTGKLATNNPKKQNETNNGKWKEIWLDQYLMSLLLQSHGLPFVDAQFLELMPLHLSQ